LLAGVGCGAALAVLVALVSPARDVPAPQANAGATTVAVAPLAASRPDRRAPEGAAPALPLLPEPPHHHRSSSGASRHTGMSGPAAQVLALTNAQRTKHGCRPLRVDSRLTRVAQQHSAEMADDGYFSHGSANGRSYSQRQISAGYSADKTGGENIARGYPTAKIVMRIWMNSPPHRENILECQFTTIGIGYVSKGDFWTQEFGY
jgi:uncharacterized protein YkwD